MLNRFILVLLSFIFLLSSGTSATELSSEEGKPEDVILSDTVQQFPAASFSDKENLIDILIATGSDRALTILKALSDNRLYYLKADQGVLIVDKGNEGHYTAENAVTGIPVSISSKRSVKKIKTNNRIRAHIRNRIAETEMRSENEEIRRQAILQLMKNPEILTDENLKSLLDDESSADIRQMLSVIQGIRLLDSSSPDERLLGLKLLERSLYPEANAALHRFINAFSDTEQQSRKEEYMQALKVQQGIESLLATNRFIENLYFGLALGAVLLLAAIGLSITFGVMGVINMAHGEMIMLGAYTTYVVQQLMPGMIGASLFVAIPAAFIVSGLVGILMERTIIRHLYGRPLETLLATFGVSLILQQAVRSLFGPLNQDVVTPDWMAGTFSINPALALTWNRLYIILFSLVVLAALAVVLKKTLFGLQMRAVTMNRPMASSMGIKTGWVDALTFGLGSGIAGVAGVALSQLTNVGPNLGQAYIIDSFMVVVFGGVGNLWGTLVGAMSLGVANKLFEPLAGAVLAKILVLVFIILFIQKRPRGLFALKGRAVESS